MAVQKILSTDTLETGFRAKYNETVKEIYIGYEFPTTGSSPANGYILRLKKFGGGYTDINLQQFYYTQTQINQFLADLAGSPYLGAWSEVLAGQGKYTTDKVIDYEGLFYRANSATNETDIPGVSTKWTPIVSEFEPLTVSIPTGSTGQFQYAYDGSLGVSPTAIVQIRNYTGNGWAFASFAEIMDDGSILARGDFSTDTYQLIIKP